MTKNDVIESTRLWVSSMVIGLNLCPFARRVFDGEVIRYSVSDARDEETLLRHLDVELKWLLDAPISQVETTLLIHPFVLEDFLDYNDFLDRAEQKIDDLQLNGFVQIASFHPRYQFAGAEPDDLENYTNRSPFPMLHLLREESVTAVADRPDELLEIPRRNIETLTRVGRTKILAMLEQCFRPRNPS